MYKFINEKKLIATVILENNYYKIYTYEETVCYKNILDVFSYLNKKNYELIYVRF